MKLQIIIFSLFFVSTFVSAYALEYTLEIENRTHTLDYNTRNVILNNVTADFDFISLTYDVTVTAENGTFYLNYPRSFFDSTFEGKNEKFVVVSDGDDLDYVGTDYSQNRFLEIPLNASVKEVEIIGSWLKGSSAQRDEKLPTVYVSSSGINQGEMFRVWGNIQLPEENYDPQYVRLEIHKQEGGRIISQILDFDQNGDWNSKLITADPLFFDAGGYLAIAMFEGKLGNNWISTQKVITPFTIYASDLPFENSPSIYFQFDKSEYNAGDSIIITGKVNEAYRELYRDPDKLFDYKVRFNVFPSHKNLNSGFTATIDGHEEFYLRLNTQDNNSADLWGGNGNYTIEARPNSTPVFFEEKTFEFYADSNHNRTSLNDNGIGTLQSLVSTWENKIDKNEHNINSTQTKLEQTESNKTKIRLQEKINNLKALNEIYDRMINYLNGLTHNFQ